MITAKLLREWGACWSDRRIADAFGSRTEVSPRTIAGTTAVSCDDRMWVMTRCLWYLDERAARLFAIETALTVAHLAGDDDDQARFLGLMNDSILIEDLPAAARARRVGRREGGREGRRVGHRDGRRVGHREGGREGGREGRREGGREGRRVGGRVGGREGRRVGHHDSKSRSSARSNGSAISPTDGRRPRPCQKRKSTRSACRR